MKELEIKLMSESFSMNGQQRAATPEREEEEATDLERGEVAATLEKREESAVALKRRMVQLQCQESWLVNELKHFLVLLNVKLL